MISLEKPRELNVLIVCSSNVGTGRFVFEIHKAFVAEQMEAVRRQGVNIDLFLIKGRGIRGYLQSARRLRRHLRDRRYDLLHAHGGHCGLVGLLQRKAPVIVTFHGSDINVGALNIISSLVTLFSAWNIFVAPKLFRRCLTKPRKHTIIPCGVDLDVFSPLEKAVALRRLGLNPDAKYILFSSRFEVPVKNYPLALEAVGRLNSRAELLELKNRSRQEVSLLLNACDLLLMTSFHEGSPQIIKEAMACNCPIVSTDVGDVREVVRGTSGCFLTERNAADVAAKIETVFSLSSRTNGREHIRHLDNRKIAGEVFKVYQDVTACRRQ